MSADTALPPCCFCMDPRLDLRNGGGSGTALRFMLACFSSTSRILRLLFSRACISCVTCEVLHHHQQLTTCRRLLVFARLQRLTELFALALMLRHDGRQLRQHIGCFLLRQSTWLYGHLHIHLDVVSMAFNGLGQCRLTQCLLHDLELNVRTMTPDCSIQHMPPAVYAMNLVRLATVPSAAQSQRLVHCRLSSCAPARQQCLTPSHVACTRHVNLSPTACDVTYCKMWMMSCCRSLVKARVCAASDWRSSVSFLNMTASVLSTYWMEATACWMRP